MIQELRKQIADDLCAQQVITNIHDCIKELVDNSIDAQSKKIQIILEDYGKKTITVSDDGCGIRDFQFLGQKGSTSKNQGNYNSVKTLGFRGQALHSLARVSQKMRIETTTNQSAHTKILNLKTFKEDTLNPKRAIGTTITIQSLFEFLPVRRYQLLNKYKQFLRKIDILIKQYCLIFPDIIFILKNIRSDKTQILIQTSKHYSADKKQRWLNRINQILGPKFADKLVYIKTENIQGWLLNKIQSGSSNQNSFIRKNQHYMYLNARPIDILPKIYEHLNTFYRKYKKGTKYIFILNLVLKEQLEAFDINLSPNKREILIKQHFVHEINQQLRLFITDNIVEDIPVMNNMQPSIQQNRNNTKNEKPQNLQIEEKQSKQGQKNIVYQSIQVKKQQNQMPERNNNNVIMHADQQRIQKKQDHEIKRRQLSKQLSKNMKQRQSQRPKLHEYSDQFQNKIRLVMQQRIENQRMLKSESRKRLGNSESQIKQKIQKDHNKINMKEDIQNKIEEQRHRKTLNIDNQKKTENKKTDKQQQLGQWLEKRVINSLKKQKFRQFKIIGQFNHGFIICQHQDQYYMIDQHAASQKYHFQRLLKSNRQQIQACDNIMLNPIDRENLEEFAKQINDDGYDYVHTSENQILLTKVPSFLGKIYGKEYFIDLIQSKTKLIDHRDFYMAAASKACRTAVMVGHVLQQKQMENIVKQLANLQSPWNCPHGRPTLISLGHKNNFITELQSLEKNNKEEYTLL